MQFLEFVDKRVADWPLLNSFIPTAAITVMYILMVAYGPKYMKNKPAWNLHYVVLCHNAFLIIMNIYSLWLLLGGAFFAGYNILCQPLTYSTDPGEIMVAKGIWWYYILRAVDLLDTMILILRKKNGHLSFLHTYHHATMFPIWWLGTNYVAGGNAFFGPLINSIVHIIMYAYYFIAEMGPAYRKYLWWKRYLTVVQMLQFLLVIGHSAQTLLTGCHQPHLFLHYCQMIYLMSLFALFANFYYQQYSNQKIAQSGRSESSKKE